MNFAVVKFLNETDDMAETVQEVPASWLCKNNTACKWPPERFVKIYISKGFPPESHWEEHPVEVEGFFDTLQEAHKRANNEYSDKETLGRGQRQVKPTDYFSPAEELERENLEKRKQFKKKPISLSERISNYHESFMNSFTSSGPPEVHNEIVGMNEEQVILDVAEDGTVMTHMAEKQDISLKNRLTLKENRNDVSAKYNGLSGEESESSFDEKSNGDIVEEGVGKEGVGNNKVNENAEGTSQGDNNRDVDVKLDRILHILADIKIDLTDLKERLDRYETQKERIIAEEVTYPVEFPMKSLNQLEELEIYLKNDEDKCKKFAALLKSIGGSDFKDFIHRICKYLFTNDLAVLCSWTGRKNNFQLENLSIMKTVFDVVHQKSKVSRKEYETTIMEWFRHARQRQLRAKK